MLQSHAIGAPKANLASAMLDVTAGFHSVTVRTGDLGGQLFRASTPVGSMALPTATVDHGRVLIGERGTKTGGGPAALDVVIDKSLTWALRFTGGASAAKLDLSSGKIHAIDFASGISMIEASLPPPDGTMLVRMSGGSSAFAVHLASKAPVRAQLTGGASTVTIDGTRHTGINGGTTFTPPGWSPAHDRYDIDCTAGVSTLTVDRNR